MRTRWQDALDIQLDIYNFISSDRGTQFGGGWLLVSLGKPNDLGRRTVYERGIEWAHQEAAIIFNAEPIWIDEPMMTLAEAAVDGFKAEPLIETDLLTQNGLLILPKPLWLNPTAEGAHRLNWSVASWMVQPRMTRLTLWHDSTAPDDLDESAKGEVGVLIQGIRWIPTHSVNWPMGEMHPGYTNGLGHDEVQRQCQAIWRLLNQTLAVKTRERPPSPFVKRAQKLNPLREHVTVVRLRRPRPDYERADEHKTVNWTHQWIVSGFWRWQWHRDDASTTPCGHVDADGDICHATGGRHRQIWVSPFVKGPEGLPLIVNKTRMFTLVR